MVISQASPKLQGSVHAGAAAPSHILLTVNQTDVETDRSSLPVLPGSPGLRLFQQEFGYLGSLDRPWVWFVVEPAGPVRFSQVTTHKKD